MPDLPRVLVLTTTFPRWKNDVQTAPFVLELCRELTDRFEMTVLAPHDPGALLEEEIDEVRVRRFIYFRPMRAERLCNGVGLLPNFRSSLMGKIQAPALFASQMLKLRRMLVSERFDLVHSHWLIPSGFSVASMRPDSAPPHLLTIHSTDLHFLAHAPFGRKTVQFIARRTDRIFVVSSHLKRMLDGISATPSPARVLPMGVGDAFLTPPNTLESRPPEWLGRKIILYVGKLIPVKGVSFLLRAFAEVRRKMSDALLILVGGGDLEHDLKSETAALGIGGDALFTGPKSREDVARYYRWADVVALPSIVSPNGETEGLPVVILEAMACGKTVVASQVGSLNDVIDSGINGWLVPPGNSSALADRLIQVLAAPPNRSVNDKAVETARRYRWKNIADAYASSYRELIGNYSKSSRPQGDKDRARG